MAIFSLISNFTLMASKKYALISDIHGNLEALNSSLDIIKKQKNIEKIIFLGDYFSLGPCPKEVFRILSDMPIETIFIRGNHERYLIERIWESKKPIIEGMNSNSPILNGIVKHQEWINNEIGVELKDFIQQRTKTSYCEDIGPIHLEFTHAWYKRDEKVPTLNKVKEHAKKYLKSNKNIKKYIFIHGHIHLKRNEIHKDLSIFCPISTGLPFDKLTKGAIGYLTIDEKEFSIAGHGLFKKTHKDLTLTKYRSTRSRWQSENHF